MGEFYVEEENFLEELKNGKYVQLNEEGIEKVVKIIEKYENITHELENAIDLTIDIIKQQPTGNDEWILERLNGYKFLLKGDKNNE